MGTDPAIDDEYWPPAAAIRPRLPGDGWQIYDCGTVRAATLAEAADLEQAAVWSRDHIIQRLLGRRSFP